MFNIHKHNWTILSENTESDSFPSGRPYIAYNEVCTGCSSYRRKRYFLHEDNDIAETGPASYEELERLIREIKKKTGLDLSLTSAGRRIVAEQLMGVRWENK